MKGGAGDVVEIGGGSQKGEGISSLNAAYSRYPERTSISGKGTKAFYNQSL